MHVHKVHDGRVMVLRPSGHILGGHETTEIVEAAREFVQVGNVAIVVDFADVDYMNSLGLGALTRILITTSNQNGRLKVCNVLGRVRKLFDVVKFDRLFVYYDSEAAALEALAKEMADAV